MARTVSRFAGVEYQLTSNLAVDVTAQRVGINGSGMDRQVLVGLTVNFGKLR
ncbi:MAG TPA: hypothetical protein VM120_08840 [Bryobacteraceae bacterium]|nr:hypothetical protein [Bryobacteraceae bacterium]